jgi:hypothetical protein
MLTFGLMLESAKLDPKTVRLLRHQDTKSVGGASPYVLWRDRRDRFEAYQEAQAPRDAARLNAPIWAAFVGTPRKETLFVGLYRARLAGTLNEDRIDPVRGNLTRAGVDNLYELTLMPELGAYPGRLVIDWGPGFRSWIQRGDGQPKPVLEIRPAFREEAFPGFAALVLRLSELEGMPQSWSDALISTRGVYLMTCPKTREQYVGSAHGAGGFLARWREYEATGHGGNVALKSRDPSDYQVSILETVGSAATEGDIFRLEALWKDKLQSREMGLNRN